MHRASYFYKDCLFGSYPTQEGVNELESNGVKHFVDLTLQNEKLTKPYTTQFSYLNFPIPDQKVPPNRVVFIKFLIDLVKLIKENLNENNKLYIHCKGGAGRAGTVVACLLFKLENLSPYSALRKTLSCYHRRRDMSDRMRKIGAPATYNQKNFVTSLCKETNIYAIDKLSPEYYFMFTYKGNTYGSIYSALKENQGELKNILMERLLQFPEAVLELISSFGNIRYHSDNHLLGVKKNHVGENAIGILYMKIRDSILREM